MKMLPATPKNRLRRPDCAPNGMAMNTTTRHVHGHESRSYNFVRSAFASSGGKSGWSLRYSRKSFSGMSALREPCRVCESLILMSLKISLGVSSNSGMAMRMRLVGNSGCRSPCGLACTNIFALEKIQTPLVRPARSAWSARHEPSGNVHVTFGFNMIRVTVSYSPICQMRLAWAVRKPILVKWVFSFGLFSNWTWRERISSVQLAQRGTMTSFIQK